MIQSSQVNQFGYPLVQSGGSGQQGLNQGEDTQTHPKLAVHSLSASGGGTMNNSLGAYRTPIHTHNPSTEYNPQYPSAFNNGNSSTMSYVGHPPNQANSSSDIKQEELASSKTRSRAATSGTTFQNMNATALRTNSGSYVPQGGVAVTMQQQQQNGGMLATSGGNGSQGQRLSIGNSQGIQKELVQGNSALNLSNESENNSNKKVCSYSFIPKDDLHERVVHIKGGILIDEKVVLGDSNEDYLVHQNFAQYIDCNLFKKSFINSSEGGAQPLEVLEIPIKKKEGYPHFSDLIAQFKSGNPSSCEIGNTLEEYQEFVNPQSLYKSNGMYQQPPSTIIKKEEFHDNNNSGHLQNKSQTLHVAPSTSQILQQQNIGISHHQYSQQQQQQLLFQPQSVVLQSQNIQMVNQTPLQQQQNYNFNNSATTCEQSYSSPSTQLQVKEETGLGNQLLIRKNSQYQQQQQIQQQQQSQQQQQQAQLQQNQQACKIEQGTELNKSNQGGNRSKQNSQTQQHLQQNLLQQNEGSLQNLTTQQGAAADNSATSDKDSAIREAINMILLRHRSEYFSYVVVYKKSQTPHSGSQQLNQQQQQQQSTTTAGEGNESYENSQQSKDDEMMIGHNTKFLTLISYDEEQLASKMIREKKLCIFLTKLNRDKYIHYLKNRISSEMASKNGQSSPPSFPSTCIGSLDSLYKPTISQLTVSNSPHSHLQSLSKQSSHPDEKFQNPETHLNSSSSSSTVQQQQQQQQGTMATQQGGSKCPFLSTNAKTSGKNFAGSGELTSIVESKIEVKSYKQIDMITLDNFLFQVNIDVIEEETSFFKITVFKYDISDLQLKELQQNRGTGVSKSGISLNASGGGTPFQRKTSKRSSIKQAQTFTEVAAKNNSRDKSVSMGEDKFKSQSFLNTSTSSLKNIPLVSNFSQDMLNPKNMQYETKSEIFIQKFYPTQISGAVVKSQNESNSGGNKASSGEHSSKNKSKQLNFSKELNQFNQSQATQQESVAPASSSLNQDQMDEEYLEQQFNLNNPTFDNNNNAITNNNNPLADNFNDHYSPFQPQSQQHYPHNNAYEYSYQQQFPQQPFAGIIGKGEESIQPEEYQKTLQENIQKNIKQQQQQGYQSQNSLPLIGQNQQLQVQQQGQPASQILKIGIPKIQQNQEKIEIMTEADNYKVKMYRPFPSQTLPQLQQEDSQLQIQQQQIQLQQQQSQQQQKGSQAKKKPQQRNSKKKLTDAEECGDEQTPAAVSTVGKTKKIKKEKDADGEKEGKKKASPKNTTEKGAASRKSNKKQEELQEEKKQNEENSSHQKLSELDSDQIDNEIKSLKNIPLSYDLVSSKNPTSKDTQKPTSTPLQQNTAGNSSVSLQNPPQNKQLLQQQQSQQQQQLQQPATPHQLGQYQFSQTNPNTMLSQPQQQYYNYQLQQHQQSGMYHQHPHNQQQQQQLQNNPHMHMYYNQNGMPVNMQQNQYLNGNGQLNQPGNFAQSPHLTYSPQLTPSPYQQAQRPPTFSPSPHMVSQGISKQTPFPPPLDLNQGNPMLQQYQQVQPNAVSIPGGKSLSQFQVPQPKSQPALAGQVVQPVQPPVSDPKQIQMQALNPNIPQAQTEVVNKGQEDTEGAKKKGKKREPKGKKQQQASTASPSKNSQEEDDGDEDSEEMNKKEKQKKTKRIYKKKDEEKVQGSAPETVEEKPAKKYQRKSKAQQNQSKDGMNKEDTNTETNTTQIPSEINQLSTQNQNSTNSTLPQQSAQSGQAYQNPQDLQQQHQSQQQQQQIQQAYYQQQYHPNHYPMHQQDYHYEQDYYGNHYYQYGQSPNSHNQGNYPQQPSSAYHYQNAGFHPSLANEHYPQSNYYQQIDQHAIPAQQAQQQPLNNNKMNTQQGQKQKQPEQANPPTEGKKGKETTAKSKAAGSKANQKQNAAQVNSEQQKQQQFYQKQINEQNIGQQSDTQP